MAGHVLLHIQWWEGLYIHPHGSIQKNKHHSTHRAQARTNSGNASRHTLFLFFPKNTHAEGRCFWAAQMAVLSFCPTDLCGGFLFHFCFSQKTRAELVTEHLFEIVFLNHPQDGKHSGLVLVVKREGAGCWAQHFLWILQCVCCAEDTGWRREDKERID